MNRFAAWSLGKKLVDTEGRYALVVGGQVDSPRKPQILTNVCLDVASVVPAAWQPQEMWDRFVCSGGWWLLDKRGQRIPSPWKGGAAATSYVVAWDQIPRMALVQTVRAMREYCHKHGSELYVDGIWRRPWAAAWQELVDLQKWNAVAEAIGEAMRGAGCQSWLGWYTSWAVASKMKWVKLEGFRFGPRFGGGWGGDKLCWGNWWDDYLNHPVMKLERAGITPIIEAIPDRGWDVDLQCDYIRMAVVTACLADRALLAVHFPGDWASPIWTVDHERAMRLGDPTAPAELHDDGRWARKFDHGFVWLDPIACTSGIEV